MHVSASFVSKRQDLKPAAPLLLVTTRCQHVPVRGVVSAMCRKGLRRSSAKPSSLLCIRRTSGRRTETRQIRRNPIYPPRFEQKKQNKTKKKKKEKHLTPRWKQLKFIHLDGHHRLQDYGDWLALSNCDRSHQWLFIYFVSILGHTLLALVHRANTQQICAPDGEWPTATTLVACCNISAFIRPLPDEPVCKHVAKLVNTLLACGREWKGRVKNRGGRKELSGIKMIYCRRLTCAGNLSPQLTRLLSLAVACVFIYTTSFYHLKKK